MRQPKVIKINGAVFPLNMVPCRRCCKSLTTKVSLCGSMVSDVVHQPAISRPRSHGELVQLRRVAQEAGVSVPLGRQGYDVASRVPRDGLLGRPAVFSDAGTQFCLSVKVLLKLALCQPAGMVASLDWLVPDFSMLCRRQKTLAVQLPYRHADGPMNLLVPSRDTTAQCTA